MSGARRLPSRGRGVPGRVRRVRRRALPGRARWTGRWSRWRRCAGPGGGPGSGRCSAAERPCWPDVRAPTVGAGGPAVPSAAPSATAPATPEKASTERAVPLYYVTDTPAGPRLAREFRRVAVDTDPGTAAVTALFAAPTGAVPDHRNTWPAGSALAAPVTHADGVVTVDLTAQAVGTTPADPILAVQQLVYTVTGALGTTDPVQVLVAGKQVTRLWGDGVDTSRPVARADPLGIRVLVGIDDPADGASAALPGADRGGGGGVRGDAAVGDPAERVGGAVRQHDDRGGSAVRAVRVLGRAAAGRLRDPRRRGRPVRRRRAPGHDRHPPRSP